MEAASFWEKLLPHRGQPGESTRILYREAGDYRSEVAFWKVVAGVLIGVLLVIGFAVGHVLRMILSVRRKHAITLACLAVIVACVVAEVSLILQGYHITAVRLCPAMPAVGFLWFVLGTLKRTFPSADSSHG